jgi:hypothetical protein
MSRRDRGREASGWQVGDDREPDDEEKQKETDPPGPA